ncbi:hypothetical protein [Clostridium estertheticum]|nr:hypothetical protein [Clostridium estertheticum]
MSRPQGTSGSYCLLMIREIKIKWQEIYYPSGPLKYEGFTKIDSK